MASSNGAPLRVRVGCDGCGAGAWIAHAQPWCEACQSPRGTGEPACPECGAPLARATPRFVELWGELQRLDGVLRAWDGESEPLARQLPARPRFVADLTPPAPRPDDPPALRALLAHVRAGRWSEALAGEVDGDARAHAARAIALERSGDPAAALAEWDRVIAAADAAAARLSRGALRAAARDWRGAAEDFASAGDAPGAGWNRASLAVHRALAKTPGLPAPEAIAVARAEAGPPPAEWSEPTVGRLAWELLAERTLARREAGEAGDFELNVLREAEDLFEHATFWDRAMVLVTYSRLELHGDVARTALPLARELAAGLLAQPALRGPMLAEFAAAVAAAYDAAAARTPRPAWRALYLWMRDERLQRYRLPCAACRRGSLGVEEFAGGEDADESPAAPGDSTG